MSARAAADAPIPIAIVGPTASGKTGLGIAVAGALGGEIISLDSRQAYRGFRVGTAAPTDEELAAAPHHGVGFLEPDERYGAGRFVELADSAARAIRGRGNLSILVGGTGMFLRALTHPMFREPEIEPVRLAALRAWLDARSSNRLAGWARRLDPALRDGEADPQRAARTLELALATGRPLSWWIEHGTPSRAPWDGLVFALDVPRDVLRQRIEDRARAMLGGAWQAEVRRLELAGHDDARAFDALGYRDVQALVHGRIEQPEALERIFAATWAYARRQRTWFRHQLPDGAIRLDGARTTEQLCRRIREEWRAAERDGTAAGATDRQGVE